MFEQVSCTGHQTGHAEDWSTEENRLHCFSTTSHVAVFGPKSINSHSLFLVNSVSQVHVCVCSPRRLSTNSRKDIQIDDINLFVFHESHANHAVGSFPLWYIVICKLPGIQTWQATEFLKREYTRVIQRQNLAQYRKIRRFHFFLNHLSETPRHLSFHATHKINARNGAVLLNHQRAFNRAPRRALRVCCVRRGCLRKMCWDC